MNATTMEPVTAVATADAVTASAANTTGAPLVEVTNLTVRFKNADATVHAVNGVDFKLRAGEVLGILGESGSGKSVTLKTLMRLLPEKKTQIGGSMRVAGHDVLVARPIDHRQAVFEAQFIGLDAESHV